MSLEDAYAAEREGNLAEASETFFRVGIESVHRTGFDGTDHRTRTGLGHILESISCDARAASTRVRPTVDLFGTVVGHCKSERVDRYWIGVYHEWEGDALLMAGDESCIERFERAKRIYSELGWDGDDWTARSTAVGEVFDYPTNAFVTFVEHTDWEFDDPFHTGPKLERRIEQKIEFAEYYTES